MVTEVLPKLTLKKEVSIKNERLNLMYILLYIPVLTYAVYTFYSGRTYTDTIPNDPLLMLTPSWSNIDPTLYVQATVPPDIAAQCRALQNDQNCTDGGPLEQSCSQLQPNLDNFTKATVKFRCKRACMTLVDEFCYKPGEAQVVEGTFSWKVLANEAIYKLDLPNKIFELDIRPSIPLSIFAKLNFTYTFKLSRPMPFFFGVENTVLSKGTNRDAVTIVLYPNQTVCKVFEPEEDLMMNVLALSEAAGTRLTVERGQYGNQIMSRVNCFTDGADTPALDWAGHNKRDPTLGKPICLLTATVVASEVSTVEPYNSTHLIFRAWWILTLQPGTSYHRVPSTAAILTMMISILVLVGLPAKIVKVFMLNMLGPLSKVYKRLFLQPFSIDDNIRQILAKMVGSGTSVQHLGVEDESGKWIPRKRIIEELKKVLTCFGHSLPEGQLNALADLTIDKAPPKKSLVQMARQTVSGKGKRTETPAVLPDGMFHSWFADNVATDGIISLDLLTELLDASRQRSITEKAFTPKPLRILEEGTKGRNTTANDSNKDDEVYTDVPNFLLRGTHTKVENVDLDNLQISIKLQMGELEARIEQKIEAGLAELRVQLDSKMMSSSAEEESTLQPMLSSTELLSKDSQDLSLDPGFQSKLEEMEKKFMNHLENFAGPESAQDLTQHLKAQIHVLQASSEFLVRQIRVLEANSNTFEGKFRILETNSEQMHNALRAIQATNMNQSKTILRLREGLNSRPNSSPRSNDSSCSATGERDLRPHHPPEHDVQQQVIRQI